MPVLQSAYSPRHVFRNGDFQTVYATFWRKTPSVVYKRERITTPDNDFLDLDWNYTGSKKIVIISHGMEGSSHSKYILCMIKQLRQAEFDSVVWNFRGCSGETNLKPRFYHSGVSDDLEFVINHVLDTTGYEEVYLLGISMGGNVTLKYAGERNTSVPAKIKKIAAIAVPCDLRSAVMRMAERRNFVYMQWFLNLLRYKIRVKARLYPDQVSFKGFNKIKNFIDFDRVYTAPLHGFKSEEDYWEKCSSKQFLGGISVPTLLINAADDPFLGKGCFPYEEAEKNPNFFLETPRFGGHVGFVACTTSGRYWSEQRVIDFFNS